MGEEKNLGKSIGEAVWKSILVNCELRDIHTGDILETAKYKAGFFECNTVMFYSLQGL